jgi:anti-sigma factor RsiW
MRPFDQSCRRYRQDISLLAAGTLPPAERHAVEQHLATCPACQEYLVQIKAVTTPLAAWAESLPQVEPTPAAQQRWATAIQATARPATLLPSRRMPFHQILWQKLILPSRLTWAGLATAWVLLIAVNMMLRDQSPATADGKPITMAAMISYGEQQKLLKELFADRSPSTDADRPKNYSPKPRTEKFQYFTA